MIIFAVARQRIGCSVLEPMYHPLCRARMASKETRWRPLACAIWIAVVAYHWQGVAGQVRAPDSASRCRT